MSCEAPLCLLVACRVPDIGEPAPYLRFLPRTSVRRRGALLRGRGNAGCTLENAKTTRVCQDGPKIVFGRFLIEPLKWDLTG